MHINGALVRSTRGHRNHYRSNRSSLGPSLAPSACLRWEVQCTWRQNGGMAVAARPTRTCGAWVLSCTSCWRCPGLGIEYLSSYCLASVRRFCLFLVSDCLLLGWWAFWYFLSWSWLSFADSCHAQLCFSYLFWGAGLLKRRMPCAKEQTVNSASCVIRCDSIDNGIWSDMLRYDLMCYCMTWYQLYTRLPLYQLTNHLAMSSYLDWGIVQYPSNPILRYPEFSGLCLLEILEAIDHKVWTREENEEIITCHVYNYIFDPLPLKIQFINIININIYKHPPHILLSA